MQKLKWSFDRPSLSIIVLICSILTIAGCQRENRQVNLEPKKPSGSAGPGTSNPPFGNPSDGSKRPGDDEPKGEGFEPKDPSDPKEGSEKKDKDPSGDPKNLNFINLNVSRSVLVK